MTKAIIFDASTLISLAMNGLFPEFRKLKEAFKGKFIITQDVKYEIIDKPIKIKRFELEALKIKQLLDDKIIEMTKSLGVDEDEVAKKTIELRDIANTTFYSTKKDIHIIDKGEVSCLALSRILDEKKISNILAIDERTMRMLVEKPQNLEKLLGKKLHTRITSRRQNFKFFRGFKIIRSAELVYVVYKKNLARLKNGPVLDALLWAVKFKGCSISRDEIEEIKRLG